MELMMQKNEKQTFDKTREQYMLQVNEVMQS